MKQEYKFKEASIKYRLNTSPYKEEMNKILSSGNYWKNMREDFIKLINNITECTENNRKQAVVKIKQINSENGFYATIGTYLSGYKLI